jgi:predicted RNase H-like nuclease (RuvC/YqgF family)
MSDTIAAASAYTVEIGKAVNQPAFAMAAAMRVPGQSGEEAQGQDAGDTVIISEQGRTMAAKQAKAQESSSEESDEEILIRQLKERIAKLQQEIQEVQQDQALSEEEKRQKVMLKQSELVQLQSQLAKAYEELAGAAGAAGQSGGMTSQGSFGATS